MITDWILIRRIAVELDASFRGARVTDVGLLPDGRTALALWQRGQTTLFCIDVFASTPLVSVESGELPIASEPGFVRALGATLRGTRVQRVRSRLGDRLLRLEFAARSAFGVEDAVALVLELVPRFGNAVLLKGETVVAALKEFSLDENAARAVESGRTYQPPPLRDARSIPRLIAQSYPAAAAAALVERFTQAEFPVEPLFVYRREGAIVQAHAVALEGFDDCTLTREASLLDVLGELRVEAVAQRRASNTGARRHRLIALLAEREKKLGRERARVAGEIERARGRDALREQGELILTTLHELDPAQRDEAKQRAAEIFARYKKLGATLAHVERRHEELRSLADGLAQLRWEAERADDADLDDVEHAIEALDVKRHGAAPARTGRAKKRAPLEWRTPGGSRILVGRSPTENAELTFKIARADDLWFHTQNIPGAHVILQRDDRHDPPLDDIVTAAALAALYSKARESAKVPVDYTHRKHVRKQQNAPPGLVFYTHQKTIIVTPSHPPTNRVKREALIYVRPATARGKA